MDIDHNKVLSIIVVVFSVFVSFISGIKDSVKEFKQFFDLHVNTNIFTNILLSPCFNFLYYFLMNNADILDKYDKLTKEIVSNVKHVDYFYIFLIFFKICILIFVNGKVFNIIDNCISLFFNKSDPTKIILKILLFTSVLFFFQKGMLSLLSDYNKLLKFLIRMLITVVILGISLYMLFKFAKKMKKMIDEEYSEEVEIALAQQAAVDFMKNLVENGLREIYELYKNLMMLLAFLFGLSFVLQLFFTIFNKIVRDKQTKKNYVAKDQFFIKLVYISSLIPYFFFNNNQNII
jgi:hypothetical protein